MSATRWRGFYSSSDPDLGIGLPNRDGVDNWGLGLTGLPIGVESKPETDKVESGTIPLIRSRQDKPLRPIIITYVPTFCYFWDFFVLVKICSFWCHLLVLVKIGSSPSNHHLFPYCLQTSHEEFPTLRLASWASWFVLLSQKFGETNQQKAAWLLNTETK